MENLIISPKVHLQDTLNNYDYGQVYVLLVDFVSKTITIDFANLVMEYDVKENAYFNKYLKATIV